MTPHTHCPRCSGRIWPDPFVGSAMLLCPHCERVIVVATDGVSFETSHIRASLPINGESCYLHIVVGGPDPRVE